MPWALNRDNTGISFYRISLSKNKQVRERNQNDFKNIRKKRRTFKKNPSIAYGLKQYYNRVLHSFEDILDNLDNHLNETYFILSCPTATSVILHAFERFRCPKSVFDSFLLRQQETETYLNEFINMCILK